MKVVYSNRFKNYLCPNHPESPERMSLIYNALKNKGGFEFVKPKKLTEKDLLLAHSQKLIDSVKLNKFFDPDTPNISGIYDISLLSASSAVTAAKIAQKEGVSFSLARPPGHHAGRNTLGGFCYFNNIAIASLKLVREGCRVAILDIDVHHGNGTQDIVKGNPSIIFCSLHQSPYYPGTGLTSQDNCYNFPLPAYTACSTYLIYLKRALKKISDFKPDVLGISVGFDTYSKDPLAQCLIESVDYQTIGKMIIDLSLPTFFVLEGGYSRDIGECCFNLFNKLRLY